MSGVLRRNRNPTGADFIDSAWELRKYTLHICTRFPQRYKKWITDYIVMFSAQCHIYAFEANNIRPTNQTQAKERENNLKKAIRALNQMYPQIELAYAMFQFDNSDKGKSNEKILDEWLPKILETEKLIKSIIKSDKNRYKNLPE